MGAADDASEEAALQSQHRQLEQKVAAYRRALAAQPQSADLACNLGAALAGLRQWADACEAYRRALQLRPQFVEAQCNLANALKELGRFPEALEAYEAALALRPNFAEGYFNLGNMFFSQRQYNRASEAFERALAIRPGYAKAANNLGNVWRELGRLEDAAASYTRASELQPGYAAAEANLAQVLEQLGRHEDAVFAAARHAVALHPRDPNALADLGSTLAQRTDYRGALECFGRALEGDSEHVEAHSLRAVIHLLRGNLGRGFWEWEWRWKQKINPPRRFPQPRWEGSLLTGRTILLHAEQGMGDVVQFIRYASVVKSYGGSVVFECYEPLVRLLSRTPGIDRIMPRGERLPAFDVHAPLSSLPFILGTTLETVPAQLPYLFVDQHLVRRWRAAMEDDGRFKIGIVWQGNPQHPRDHLRSLSLAAFRDIARFPGARLYSLQKGAGSEQLATAHEFGMVDLGSRIQDYADTAAALANLDLLISADTSALHVAGALGLPAWALITRLPDWRWLLDRTTSPWYPTVRLFRQSAVGGWGPVLSRVYSALINGEHRFHCQHLVK
jgi:tetratricopeptide (TPR) repeat protein